MKDQNKQNEPMRYIMCVSKHFRNEIRQVSEEIGLTPAYRPFLMELSRKDGQTQLELAGLTMLAAPTVSLTLQKMETSGYVIRNVDDIDARQIRVFLTDKGREVNQKFQKIASETADKAFTGITEEEKKTLVAILTKVKDNFK